MKRSFDILRRLWCCIVGHDQWSQPEDCCRYSQCRRCGKVWSGRCVCDTDEDAGGKNWTGEEA